MRDLRLVAKNSFRGRDALLKLPSKWLENWLLGRACFRAIWQRSSRQTLVDFRSRYAGLPLRPTPSPQHAQHPFISRPPSPYQ